MRSVMQSKPLDWISSMVGQGYASVVHEAALRSGLGFLFQNINAGGRDADRGVAHGGWHPDE
jgi:hypothetical protein